MKKEELAKQYADKKVDEQQINYPVEFRPEDIKQAYEDGYDKAVELAVGFLDKVGCGYVIRELLTGEPYECKIIEDFKDYMKGE